MAHSRRFVYIGIPDRALPEKNQYWQRNSNTVSSRAEEQTRKRGHLLQILHQRNLASSCTNDIVCRTCKQPGHKSGHASGPLPPDDSSSSTVIERLQTPGTPAPSPDSGDVEPDQRETTAATTTTTTTTATLPPPATLLRPGSRRGRESTQSTLIFQGRSQSVPREKRTRSNPTPPRQRERVTSQCSPMTPTTKRRKVRKGESSRNVRDRFLWC